MNAHKMNVSPLALPFHYFHFTNVLQMFTLKSEKKRVKSIARYDVVIIKMKIETKEKVHDRDNASPR